jgi:hypothetical protein
MPTDAEYQALSREDIQNLAIDVAEMTDDDGCPICEGGTGMECQWHFA